MDGPIFNTNVHESGVWSRILASNQKTIDKYIMLNYSLRKRMGNFNNIKLWYDVWIDHCPFKRQFNRLLYLENDCECLLIDKRNGDEWK